MELLGKVKLSRMKVSSFPTKSDMLASLTEEQRPIVKIGYHSSEDQYGRELKATVIGVERGGPNDDQWTFIARTRIADEIHYFRIQLPTPASEGSFSWLW